MKKLYYVETEVGCGIKKAETATKAKKQVIKELGSLIEIQVVREATEEDIAWVTGMGGYVPKLNWGKNDETSNS